MGGKWTADFVEIDRFGVWVLRLTHYAPHRLLDTAYGLGQVLDRAAHVMQRAVRFDAYRPQLTAVARQEVIACAKRPPDRTVRGWRSKALGKGPLSDLEGLSRIRCRWRFPW